MIQLILFANALGLTLIIVLIIVLIAALVTRSSKLAKCTNIIGAVSFFCLTIGNMGDLFISNEPNLTLFPEIPKIFLVIYSFVFAIIFSITAIIDILKK